MKVSGRKTESGLVISVIGNGIGISEEALPHIFEEFYSSREGAEFNKLSSGLGLAIVRVVGVALGLGIKVESKLGEGTRFDVTVPIKESVAG